MLIHSFEVAKIATVLNRQMNVKADLNDIYASALFHDIGKVRIDKSIIHKAGSLSSPERKEMEEHIKYSREILEEYASKRVALIAGQHHEMLDGSGYPDKLLSKRILLESKILAVADCFSALAQKRSYKEKESIEEVFSELRKMPLDQSIVDMLFMETHRSPSVLFHENFDMITPFFFSDEKIFYDVSPDFFERKIFSSYKLSDSLKELFFVDGKGRCDSSICAYLVEKGNHVPEVLSFSENGNLYQFSFSSSELLLFEQGIGFLLTPVHLIDVNGHLPMVTECVDFFSFVTQVREKRPLLSKNSDATLSKRIVGQLAGIGGLYFPGNNKPSYPEEKPKIFGNLLMDGTAEELRNVCAHLSKNERYADNVNASHLYEKAERSFCGVSRNGSCMININYDNHVIGLSEVEISYILLWYENYCQEKQLEKTTCLPRDVFEEATIRKNYEQIMRIKADYALFKFRSHFVAYTRIDEVNDVINYWRDYFSTISVEKKLDEDLSNLGEIMSLANETIRNKENKAKKRRQNRIDFIIVLLTSVLSLFSITEGVFKLCERVESAVEYSENIAKIIIGFALWIGVVLFTVLKNKGTSKE